MSPWHRWRIAIPLTLISAVLLGATLLGAWAYWSTDNTTRNLITAFLAVMFATCFAVSMSIGLDRRIDSVPWLRIATIAVLIALACGVSWVRDTI